MEKDQGIESQTYSDKGRPDETYSAIVEIVRDMSRASPSCGITVKFQGHLMTLYYHTTESHLHAKMQEVEKQANDALNKALSHIKKEFKKRLKRDLDPVEKRDNRNHSVQKTSLNERYYLTFWRSYSFSAE